jgi:hypothetical protein
MIEKLLKNKSEIESPILSELINDKNIDIK